MLDNAIVICKRRDKFAVFEADFALLSTEDSAVEAAYYKTSIRFCESHTLAKREAKRLAAEVKNRVRLVHGILDFTKKSNEAEYTVVVSNMKVRKQRKSRK